jgi:hypothetical protein
MATIDEKTRSSDLANRLLLLGGLRLCGVRFCDAFSLDQAPIICSA